VIDTINAERDVRIEILNSLLTSPHKKLADLAPVHRRALERDPRFYAHAAPWYFETGEVRDHKTLFVAHLLTADYPELREVGWVLLQELAPYEVARVVDHAKQVVGKAPRVLKSAVRSYLRTREGNPRQFDGAALRGRPALKHLYAALRLKPGERAQAILFDERPPLGSSLAILKRLARTESAAEQASIIVESKIPYLIAIGAVKTVTPALLVALITGMTPQEVVNSLKALKRRGAFDNAEVKALIEAKLAAVKSDRRVSTFKAKKAIAASDVDETTEKLLADLTNQRVAAKVQIARPTALFVDKSGSMTEAIRIAQELAALISAVATGDFRVYTFDTIEDEIEVKTDGPDRPTHADWEAAFKFVKANGGTSIGVPLVRMRREGVRVEQIVIVTDEGENTAPFFRDVYARYAAELKVAPNVVIVHVGRGGSQFSDDLTRRGVEVLRYVFGGDYYALPNLLPLLAMPTRAELVDLIMRRVLPKRPA
jgi:hypothetical protein